MFILHLISSSMAFVFVTITPRYLNFSTLSKDKFLIITRIVLIYVECCLGNSCCWTMFMFVILENNKCSSFIKIKPFLTHGVRSGMVNYMSMFVPNVSQTAVLQEFKNVWTSEHEKAWIKLKHKLVNAPILRLWCGRILYVNVIFASRLVAVNLSNCCKMQNGTLIVSMYCICR